MADTLSRGPDREPSRWTSPFALTVAGVIVVALALLVRGALDHHPAAARHARIPEPGPSVVAGPKEPGEFTGRPRASGGGSLLLTGPRPGWLQTATGRFRAIEGLPRSQEGYEFTRLGGGWAVQQYSPPQADCQKCDDPPAIYFLPDHRARVTYVGAAFAPASAARPGALWLTAYLPGANLVDASGTAQEVTTGGRTVGRPVRLPAGYLIDRAVTGGLLLEPYSQGDGRPADELWAPGQPTRRFTGMLAASSAYLARDPCPRRCPLEISDLLTGTTRTVPLSAGAAAFSADGRYLAVQVSTAIQRDGYAAATHLEVINTATVRVDACRSPRSARKLRRASAGKRPVTASKPR